MTASHQVRPNGSRTVAVRDRANRSDGSSPPAPAARAPGVGLVAVGHDQPEAHPGQRFGRAAGGVGVLADLDDALADAQLGVPDPARGGGVALELGSRR